MTRIGLNRWEHFPHDADVGIRGYGNTIAEAFAQAAIAVTAAICDVDKVKPLSPRAIQCAAPDLELLFVDWLNALIYTMAVEQMLFSRFDIHITGTNLRATAWGEAVDRMRHQPAVEVKGATYTELSVTMINANEWLAQCVIDV
jgi:SHS2 domain-containing protein